VSTILALDNVAKSYGALRVTDDITLSVQAGETLGILGPNGAGKTTLFNLISGDVRTDSGRVQFDGRDITREPPHKRCRLGIGRSYQIPQPFAAMTVFENVVAAASFGTGKPERETYRDAVEILRDILRFWTRIEIDLGSFEQFGDVEADEVTPGRLLLFQLCIDAYVEGLKQGQTAGQMT